MNIIEKLILKNKKFKKKVDNKINYIRVLFDNYEHEEDILDYLEKMEYKMKYKYRYRVSICDKLSDKIKISYIKYYLQTYIDIDEDKYYNSIKNIENYIFKK